ncbi:MAG: hypothetical protein KF805_13460 [Phycisphaeraceae bacterium]|nr:hypothetical protein [Phycisphaeraceae bacterium]
MRHAPDVVHSQSFGGCPMELEMVPGLCSRRELLLASGAAAAAVALPRWVRAGEAGPAPEHSIGYAAISINRFESVAAGPWSCAAAPEALDRVPIRRDGSIGSALDRFRSGMASGAEKGICEGESVDVRVLGVSAMPDWRGRFNADVHHSAGNSYRAQVIVRGGMETPPSRASARAFADGVRISWSDGEREPQTVALHVAGIYVLLSGVARPAWSELMLERTRAGSGSLLRVASRTGVCAGGGALLIAVGDARARVSKAQ